MFEKELMIAGLRKQTELIGELLGVLEEKPDLRNDDPLFYEERTKLVARNLRKLRKLKSDYCEQEGNFTCFN